MLPIGGVESESTSIRIHPALRGGQALKDSQLDNLLKFPVRFLQVMGLLAVWIGLLLLLFMRGGPSGSPNFARELGWCALGVGALSFALGTLARLLFFR